MANYESDDDIINDFIASQKPVSAAKKSDVTDEDVINDFIESQKPSSFATAPSPVAAKQTTPAFDLSGFDTDTLAAVGSAFAEPFQRAAKGAEAVYKGAEAAVKGIAQAPAVIKAQEKLPRMYPGGPIKAGESAAERGEPYFREDPEIERKLREQSAQRDIDAQRAIDESIGLKLPANAYAARTSKENVGYTDETPGSMWRWLEKQFEPSAQPSVTPTPTRTFAETSRLSDLPPGFVGPAPSGVSPSYGLEVADRRAPTRIGPSGEEVVDISGVAGDLLKQFEQERTKLDQQLNAQREAKGVAPVESKPITLGDVAEFLAKGNKPNAPAVMPAEQFKKEVMTPGYMERVGLGGTLNDILSPLGIEVPLVGNVPLNVGSMAMGFESEIPSVYQEIAKALTGKEIQQENVFAKGTPFTSLNVGRAPVIAVSKALGELSDLSSGGPKTTIYQANEFGGFPEYRKMAAERRGEAQNFMEMLTGKAQPQSIRQRDLLETMIEGVGSIGGNVADIAKFFIEIPDLPHQLVDGKDNQAIYNGLTEFSTEAVRGITRPLVSAARIVSPFTDPAERQVAYEIAATRPVDMMMSATMFSNFMRASAGAAGEAVLRSGFELPGAQPATLGQRLQRTFRIGDEAAKIDAYLGELNIKSLQDWANVPDSVKAKMSPQVLQAMKAAELPSWIKTGTKYANEALQGLEIALRGPTLGAWEFINQVIKRTAFEGKEARGGVIPALLRQWVLSPSNYMPEQIKDMNTQFRNSIHGMALIVTKKLAEMTGDEALKADVLAAMNHDANMVDIREIVQGPTPLLLESPEAAGARRLEESKPGFVAQRAPSEFENLQAERAQKLAELDALIKERGPEPVRPTTVPAAEPPRERRAWQSDVKAAEEYRDFQKMTVDYWQGQLDAQNKLPAAQRKGVENIQAELAKAQADYAKSLSDLDAVETSILEGMIASEQPPAPEVAEAATTPTPTPTSPELLARIEGVRNDIAAIETKLRDAERFEPRQPPVTEGLTPDERAHLARVKASGGTLEQAIGEKPKPEVTREAMDEARKKVVQAEELLAEAKQAPELHDAVTLQNAVTAARTAEVNATLDFLETHEPDIRRDFPSKYTLKDLREMADVIGEPKAEPRINRTLAEAHWSTLPEATIVDDIMGQLPHSSDVKSPNFGEPEPHVIFKQTEEPVSAGKKDVFKEATEKTAEAKRVRDSAKDEVDYHRGEVKDQKVEVDIVKRKYRQFVKYNQLMREKRWADNRVAKATEKKKVDLASESASEKAANSIQAFDQIDESLKDQWNSYRQIEIELEKLQFEAKEIAKELPDAKKALGKVRSEITRKAGKSEASELDLLNASQKKLIDDIQSKNKAIEDIGEKIKSIRLKLDEASGKNLVKEAESYLERRQSKLDDALEKAGQKRGEVARRQQRQREILEKYGTGEIDIGPYSPTALSVAKEVGRVRKYYELAAKSMFKKINFLIDDAKAKFIEDMETAERLDAAKLPDDAAEMREIAKEKLQAGQQKVVKTIDDTERAVKSGKGYRPDVESEITGALNVPPTELNPQLRAKYGAKYNEWLHGKANEAIDMFDELQEALLLQAYDEIFKPEGAEPATQVQTIAQAIGQKLGKPEFMDLPEEDVDLMLENKGMVLPQRETVTSVDYAIPNRETVSAIVGELADAKEVTPELIAEAVRKHGLDPEAEIPGLPDIIQPRVRHFRMEQGKPVEEFQARVPRAEKPRGRTFAQVIEIALDNSKAKAAELPEAQLERVRREVAKPAPVAPELPPFAEPYQPPQPVVAAAELLVRQREPLREGDYTDLEYPSAEILAEVYRMGEKNAEAVQTKLAQQGVLITREQASQALQAWKDALAKPEPGVPTVPMPTLAIERPLSSRLIDERINKPLSNGKTPSEVILELKARGLKPPEILTNLHMLGFQMPKHPNKVVLNDLRKMQLDWVKSVFANEPAAELPPGRQLATRELAPKEVEEVASTKKEARDLEATKKAKRIQGLEQDLQGLFATQKGVPTVEHEALISDVENLIGAEKRTGSSTVKEEAARRVKEQKVEPTPEPVQVAMKNVMGKAKDGRVNGIKFDRDNLKWAVDPEIELLLKHTIETDPKRAPDAAKTLMRLQAQAVSSDAAIQAFKLIVDLSERARKIGEEPRDPESALKIENLDREIAELDADDAKHLEAIKVAEVQIERSRGRPEFADKRAELKNTINERERLIKENQKKRLANEESRAALKREPLFYSPENLQEIWHPESYETPSKVMEVIDSWIDAFKRADDVESGGRLADLKKTIEQGKKASERKIAERESLGMMTPAQAQGAKEGVLMRNIANKLGLTFEERVKLGRKTDVREVWAEKVISLAQAIAKFDMYHNIWLEGRKAKPSDWRMKVFTEAELDAYRQSGKPIEINGKQYSPDEWRLVPDTAMGYHPDGRPWPTKRYGELGGMYVHSDVHWLTVGMDQMARSVPYLSKIVNFAKAAKTIWNPAAHMRNLWANVYLFSTLEGVSPFNPSNWKFYKEALTDVLNKKKSSWYDEAYQAGVWDANFARNELSTKPAHEVAQGLFGNMEAFGDNLNKTFDKALSGKERVRAAGKAVGQVVDTPSSVYSVTDDVFRYVAWRKAMAENGFANPLMPGEVASPERIKMANALADQKRDSFVNYSDTSRLVQAIAKPQGAGGPTARAVQAVGWSLLYGAPFFTFQAKAIPMVLERMNFRPLENLALTSMAQAITYSTAAANGVTHDEVDAILRNRDKRLQKSVVRGFSRDEQGNLKVKLQDIQEAFIGFDKDVMGEKPGDTFMDKLSKRAGQNFIGQAIYGPIRGEDALGRPLWSRNIPGEPDSSFMSWTKSMVQLFGPTWYPSFGILPESYQTEKLRNAEDGLPNWKGELQSKTEAIKQAFLGSKEYDVSVTDMAANQLMSLSRDIESALKDIEAQETHRWKIPKETMEETEEPGAQPTELQMAKQRILMRQRNAFDRLIDDYTAKFANLPVSEVKDLRELMLEMKKDLRSGITPYELSNQLKEEITDFLSPLQEERLNKLTQVPAVDTRVPAGMLTDEMMRLIDEYEATHSR